MYGNAANVISGLRMVISIILLALDPFSWQFLVLFFICGLTDVLDGWVARRYHLESEFGSRLDSLADIVMFVCLAYIILTHVEFPVTVIVLVICIITMKAVSVLVGARKGFSGLRHSTVNRAMGLLVFLSIPLLLHWDPIPVEYTMCILALLASSYELYLNVMESREISKVSVI